MKKLKLLFAACALLLGVSNAWGEDVDYTSYITNADLSSKEGWTLKATGGSWSDVKGTAPSFVLEAYAGWGNLDLTSYSIKQNVTLPSGKYRAEGYAFYRYGLTYNVNPSISNANFVAGDFSSKVVSLGSIPLDETLKSYPNSVDEASAAFTNGYYKSQVEFAIESESTIEFGYEGTHTLKQSWFIAGPIKLYRTGDFDYSLYQQQLEDKVNDAKALVNSKMATSIKTELQGVINTYDGQTCSSVAEYNTAYGVIDAAISKANASIASYAIIAAGTVPDDKLDGWTCENANTFHINTWSVEGNSDGSNMKTPFIENWVGKGSYLGAGKVYYQLNGMEPGEVYYAQALVRSYNEANSDAPNGPNFFINDKVVDMTTAGTTFTYNGMSGIYATLGGAATVGDDGILKLGVEIAEDRNYNWVAFKSVSIRSMQDALDEAREAANALVGKKMNNEVAHALALALESYGTGTPTSAQEYEEAIEALETATEAAVASVTNYEEAATIINAASGLDTDGRASYAANESVLALSAVYNDGTLVAVSADQKTACAAALATAVRAQTTDGSDWTLAIVNNSFETGSFSGWDNSGMAVQGNDSFEKVGNYYAEKWQPNGTFSVKQTLKDIRMGIYRISAKSKARGVQSAKIFAGNEETAITIADETNTYNVEFTFYTDPVTIGFEGVGDGTASSWLCVDNFTMTYVRQLTDEEKIEKAKADLNAAITAAGSARKSANEGTGVFQIPAAAGSTLAGAITDAQNVYNNVEATISDVTTAISTLNTAVETYETTALNAPDASDVFNVMITTGDDYAFKNNPLTFNADNASGAYFPQGIGVKAYRAQQITFTQVEGNKYTLSMVNADGNRVYIGTNKTINNTGEYTQIRLTTDGTKALAVKVEPTATEGVYHLWNTEAEALLGCQDNPAEKTTGGIYTCNSHNDFTITAASKPSVSMAIASGVKYATRIFPFAPTTWPNGVVAYSCAASADGELTLVEDNAPKANVPYILYAESGSTGSVSGFGSATETSYTEGWLTGVYEDTKATAGTYVLQNNNGNVAFYVVEAEKEPTVGANRCYLSVPAQEGRSAYFFPGSGEVITGINAAVKALTSGKAQIFNASGAQIPALQKGINIIILEDGTTQKIVVQ